MKFEDFLKRCTNTQICFMMKNRDHSKGGHIHLL